MNQKLPFEQARRLFLFAAAAGAGSVALSACGGAQGQTADDAPLDPAPAPGGAPAPGPAPAPSPGPSSAPPPAPGPGPAPAPPPSAGTAPGTFTYQIEATESSAFPPGTTTRIATGAAGMVVQVSPDLPPGRTLSLATNGDVNIVAAAGAPQADLHRPWVIEVMRSPIATIHNQTLGRTYGKTHNGTTFTQVMEEARDGDVIEISPGAVNEIVDDCRNYFFFLDNTAMAVTKGVTIRNMAGHGRWRLFPEGTAVPASYSGITIFDPLALGGRKSFTVEGFDIVEQFGTNRDAYGVRIRGNGSDGSTFNSMHVAATIRNFKVGKTSGTTGSGFSGSVETLRIEDGHVFDCGNDGYEHNLYVSARTMTLHGVRCARTRGPLDGHSAKLSAVTGLIEGCVFDATPQGDMSHLLQLKAGGNFTVRGCLFIDSIANMAAGRGHINMCRELSGAGQPNYEWWAGMEGNSLLIEKSVFIGHYGRAVLHFFPSGHPYNTGLTMSAVTVRDNIGMITDTPSVIANFPGLAGADYDNRKLWILNDPTSTAGWVQRGNAVMPYGAGEPGFAGKALKRYKRNAGPITVQRTVSTQRFVYPHGHEPRNDSYGGLG
jgi:hypothetical protein